MKFQAAYAYLKRGHCIALPEWGGYWKWDDEHQTVQMHTRKGDVLDIRASEDMAYTLEFTFRDDWELVSDTTGTEHAQASLEHRPESIEALKVRRRIRNLEQTRDAAYQARDTWFKEREQALDREERLVKSLRKMPDTFPIALRKMWSGGEVQEWLRTQSEEIIRG